MQLFDIKLKDYIKEYNANKNIDSGGGGSIGAIEPEPYKPINLDEFLKAPSTEEMNQKQNTLLALEKDYEVTTSVIDEDYELYKEYTKQLDDLEVELQEAPEELQSHLNQKYNQLRDEHNILVEKLQGNTKRQKEIYQEYTKIRTTYDKDIEIYNRWAKAQNEKEPEPKEISFKQKKHLEGREVSFLKTTRDPYLQSSSILDNPSAIGGALGISQPLDLDKINKYVAAPLKGVTHGIYSTPQAMGGLMRLWGENMEKLEGTPNIFMGDDKKYKDLIDKKIQKPETRLDKFLIDKSQEIIIDNRKFLEKKELYPDPDDPTAAWLFQLGSGVTSLAGAVGISLLTHSPHAAAIAFGLYQTGGIYQEAREADVETGKATGLAVTAGVIEGALEYIGLQWLFTKFGGNFWVNRLLHAGLEGFQELSQQLGENLVAILGWDKTRSILRGTAESTSIGAVLGGGASAITANIDDTDLGGLTSKQKKGLIESIINKQSIEVREMLSNLNPKKIAQTLQDPDIQDAILGVVKREALAYKVEEEPGKVEPVLLTEKAPEFIGDKKFKGDKAKTRNTYLLAKHLYEKGLIPQDLMYYQGSDRLPVDITYKLRMQFNIDELQKAFDDIKRHGVEELTEKKYIPKIEEKGFFDYLDDLLYRSGKGEKYKQLKPEISTKEVTPKVEPKAPGQIYKDKAWRADTGVTGFGETGQTIVDFEAKELGNKDVKEDAEKVAKKLEVDLSKVAGKDVVWVAESSEVAERYGEAEEYELTKDNVILAKDDDGGFLILKNADKYKTEPKVPAEIKAKEKEEPKKEDFESLETTDKNKVLFYERYKKLYDETIEYRDMLINERVSSLKEEGGKGIEPGGLKRNEEGEVIGRYPSLSKNPKWYRDFYKVHKRKPKNEEYREIAVEQLTSGYVLEKEGVPYGEIVPSQDFIYFDARLDILNALLADVKSGDYSFKVSENVGKLNEKITDFEKEIVSMETKYEEKIKEIRALKKEATKKEKEKTKSLEEKTKESQKEINRLKGIIKTIKGNKEKRQEFKKKLVEYIKENMPYAIRNKMIATVKNVSGDKALEKAMEKIDEYTLEHYSREYTKAINNELKAKKIKPKRQKSGMLKGRFTPAIQDKLDFIRTNINGSRTKAIEKIQENITLFNQGKAINIQEENELLNMVGIKEMDLETLQFTLTNIKSLKKEGKTLKGIKDTENRKRHEGEIIDTLESTTGRQVEIDEETGKGIIDSSYRTLPKTKEMSWIKRTIDKIVNWQFGWDNLLDKLSVLDKISKPYESKLSKIGDKVHYARVANIGSLEDVLSLIQVKFAEAFEVTSRKEITQICQKLREQVDLGEFKNSKGDEVHFVLTKEQILKKVMQLDDPTLDKTFDDGMLFTEEIEDAFRNSVSKKEQAWIDGVREIYDYMWERISPIFEEMYGIHFPRNPFYSGTIRRDIDIDTPEASLLAQDAFSFASVLNPSLKARSKSKQSLQYDDMTASLMNYVMQMEHFINFAKPLNDLRSVFGDKRVKAVIHELFGMDVLKKINGFLDDITRDGVDKAKIIKSVDTIRFNFTRSILAKPHIALKQIPSVLAYMTEMPVVDFFEGVGNFWKNPIKNYRYLVENSPYARARFGEGFERDIHGAMQSDYVHLLSHTHKFSDMFMGMVRAGDKFAVMQGMWAKFYSETKGQTTKAKNAKQAIRRAEIVTQRTQPSFTIESLATGQRGGSFLKLFTMFQNQPNKYFRIIADNARNFKYGRGSRAKAASNIVLAWAILPMIFQFIGDGGKWIKKHQLRALILGAVNDLLVFGSMIRGMYGWLIKEAYDVNASPVFATLREMEYCLAKVAKWSDPTRDIEPEDIQAFTEHFAKGLGQLVGLPTPYGVQVKKAIESGDYRQLLFSEYILELGEEKKKKKKPYVKSYGDKYTKYLKGKYNKQGKYTKYLKKY